MTPSESTQVASEIAELRRTIEVGFTKTDGSLALLVQRSDQTDQQIAAQGDQSRAHEARLDVLERGETEQQRRERARVDVLERGRWPLPSLAAATGLGSLAVALYALVAR